ncbi:hypothetical protein Srut_19420 [Streptomyces rutgersensis]|nr:hypothetical protein Srut_19420 [Streptomyces rutgersensis]
MAGGAGLAVRRQGVRLLPWTACRVSCRVRAYGRLPYGSGGRAGLRARVRGGYRFTPVVRGGSPAPGPVGAYRIRQGAVRSGASRRWGTNRPGEHASQLVWCL